jgi:hypothetical protein
LPVGGAAAAWPLAAQGAAPSIKETLYVINEGRIGADVGGDAFAQRIRHSARTVHADQAV